MHKPGITVTTLAQSKQLICLRVLIKGTKCSITPIQPEPGPGTRLFPTLRAAVTRTGKAGIEGNCLEVGRKGEQRQRGPCQSLSAQLISRVTTWPTSACSPPPAPVPIVACGQLCDSPLGPPVMSPPAPHRTCLSRVPKARIPQSAHHCHLPTTQPIMTSVPSYTLRPP